MCVEKGHIGVNREAQIPIAEYEMLTTEHGNWDYKVPWGT